jgi:hypothetical protein
MNSYKKLFLAIIASAVFFPSCKKDPDPIVKPEPQLIFKFKFDSTQTRLDNFGSPASMPVGNAGQSPVFNKIGSHYIELASDSLTPLGSGRILYNGPTTTLGGATAIDFEKEKLVSEGEIFLAMNLKDVSPGTYRWLRVSLSYQNYDVKFRIATSDFTGRLASFVGYNSYIKTYKPKDSLVTINENKLQGYWAFETAYTLDEGQAPGTTVPNPISASSPIPAGSCAVTGRFLPNFTITGNETEDIVINISLSTNKSFEWQDGNSNNIWEPSLGENVVDMGLRGLNPIVGN